MPSRHKIARTAVASCDFASARTTTAEAQADTGILAGFAGFKEYREIETIGHPI
jgi:hypothetical protein